MPSPIFQMSDPCIEFGTFCADGLDADGLGNQRTVFNLAIAPIWKNFRQSFGWGGFLAVVDVFGGELVDHGLQFGVVLVGKGTRKDIEFFDVLE